MRFFKEKWNPGERAWFEYHCWESPESGDADLWYRSHQRVTVIRMTEDTEHYADDGWTFAERAEAGEPNCYYVRFPDGHEGTVFEDELSTRRTVWYRPDPPKPKVNA